MVLDLITTNENKRTENNLEVIKYLAFDFYWNNQCNWVVGENVGHCNGKC